MKNFFKNWISYFHPESSVRIGTGEFTDSLIWEPMSNLTERLVKSFAGQSTSILELKTKTVSIQTLREINHNRKTILAWSLNTESVIKSEERKTAPLEARLKAAAACESYGYPLAFHFDPLVVYDGCEADYLTVIKKYLITFPPECRLDQPGEFSVYSVSETDHPEAFPPIENCLRRIYNRTGWENAVFQTPPDSIVSKDSVRHPGYLTGHTGLLLYGRR